MSAATINRALREVKVGGRSPRRQGVAGTALRRSVPVRTFSDWDDPAPGYIEADLVSHSGPVAKGSFAWTFTLTDIATGWTECAPLLVREQTVLIAVLNELRRVMPFAMLGFDTDNDSVFFNETVRDYCAAAGSAFTRCRPYRKNDQAWVEQKNGSVVRRLVGYRRFEGIEATAVLADLYAAARLFVNFFQPSFKLAEKRRDGARVHKRYHAPATPCQRLLDDPRTDDDTRERLRAMHIGLDPVQLLRDIRVAQQRLVALTDTAAPTRVSEAAVPELDAFLSGLRIAWKSGEARPTATAKPKAPRGRRRPDPLVNVTAQLKRWFEEEPWRTGRELLEKLQAEQLSDYPESLLRTVQRRQDLATRACPRSRIQRLSRPVSHQRSNHATRNGRDLMGCCSAAPTAALHPIKPDGSGRPRGVGNIVVRQRHGPSGTSLSEATRCAHPDRRATE